jgi:hypothetical protein
VPIGFLPQLPPTQLLGLVQSAFDVHAVRQAALAPHTYGSHDDADVVWQVPVPLQVRAGVNVDPVHMAPAQVVPAAYSRQAPAPSQDPSVPQLGMPLFAHCSSGSAPTGTNVQVPALPASAHERHVPVQVDPQQTPCWHRPEAHSAALVHAAARGFFEHCPALQMLGAAQSASLAHAVRQVPLVPQLYAPHEIAVAAWQVPAPLHVRSGVWLPAAHIAAAHAVPLA